jgi:hypothetical protein
MPTFGAVGVLHFLLTLNLEELIEFSADCMACILALSNSSMDTMSTLSPSTDPGLLLVRNDMLELRILLALIEFIFGSIIAL